AGVGGRVFHRQVRALGYRGARINLDKRERPSQARIRVYHQAAVVQRVVFGPLALHGQELIGRHMQVEGVVYQVFGEQVAIGHRLIASRVEHRKIVEGDAFLIKHNGLAHQPER
nr:hypothetical protein [Tanacetum cinerariifolium]